MTQASISSAPSDAAAASAPPETPAAGFIAKQPPPPLTRGSSGSATASLTRPRGLIAVFMLPALLVYTGLFVQPMAHALYLSLFKGSPTSEKFEYVGLENFRMLLLEDAVFWSSLWHNFQFVVVAGSATMVLALAIAYGLTRCGRGRDFFRLVFLFPNMMSIVAVTILWSFVFNPSFGILNGALSGLHLGSFARAWLGEPGTALWAVMAVHVWATAGFYIVLFYAGMLRVSGDYSEAARIDGAGPWQEFRYITLPLLSEVMKIAAVYIVVNAANVFALVFLMNEGRPARYNGVLLTYMYEQAFGNGNYGYACAIGVALLVTVVLAAVAVNLIIRKEAVEQ